MPEEPCRTQRSIPRGKTKITFRQVGFLPREKEGERGLTDHQMVPEDLEFYNCSLCYGGEFP